MLGRMVKVLPQNNFQKGYQFTVNNERSTFLNRKLKLIFIQEAKQLPKTSLILLPTMNEFC